MAFTGVAVLKTVADGVVRITGLSLGAGASGTIGLFGSASEVSLPDDFDPKPYARNNVTQVELVDSLDCNVQCAGDGPAAQIGAAAMFYGLTEGTGNTGSSDYPDPVAVDAAVPFPRSGPATGGSGVVAGGTNQFVLPVTGIYRVSWAVDFVNLSQLIVKLGTVEQAHTCALSGAINQQNTNEVLVSATAGDLLSICNPSGNSTALEVEEPDGETLTHAQAPSLMIELVSCPTPGAGCACICVTKQAHPFQFTVTNHDMLAASAELEMYVRFHT